MMELPAQAEGSAIFSVWSDRLQVQLAFDLGHICRTAESMTPGRKAAYWRRRKLLFVQALHHAGFRLREIGIELRLFADAVRAESDRRKAANSNEAA